MRFLDVHLHLYYHSLKAIAMHCDNSFLAVTATNKHPLLFTLRGRHGLLLESALSICYYGKNGPPRASAPIMATIPDAISALKRLVDRELGENIWQSSYHDHVIRNDNDYREIWNYINTNPARWHEDCFYTE